MSIKFAALACILIQTVYVTMLAFIMEVRKKKLVVEATDCRIKNTEFSAPRDLK